jgi:hypothetical protein
VGLHLWCLRQLQPAAPREQDGGAGESHGMKRGDEKERSRERKAEREGK